MKPVYLIIFASLMFGCASKGYVAKAPLVKIPESQLTEESKEKPAEKATEKHAVRTKGATHKQEAWEVQSVKGSVIHFKNQKTLNTKLAMLKVITIISSEDATPYILVSGKECSGAASCEAYTNLYIHRLQDDPVKTKSFTGGAPMPGRLLDPNNKRKPTQFYSVYHGECLDNKPPMILWFGWTLNSAQKREKVVAAYMLDGKAPTFEGLPEPLPMISHIQKNVRDEFCTEIRGMDQVML